MPTVCLAPAARRVARRIRFRDLQPSVWPSHAAVACSPHSPHLASGLRRGVWPSPSRKELSMLSRNESLFDRALRICVGVVLLSLVVVGPRSAWGLIGAVPLVTGLVGF